LGTLVIADTDVIIDFFAGREPFATKFTALVDNNGLALTSITVFELYAGVTGSKRLKQIDDLISLLPVYPLDKIDAAVAAKIYGDLKKAGQLIGPQDILIAGICIAHDLPLITRNTEHFSRLKQLKLFTLS
jgi:predicted nucleic acid-binding protein